MLTLRCFVRASPLELLYGTDVSDRAEAVVSTNLHGMAVFGNRSVVVRWPGGCADGGAVAVVGICGKSRDNL